VSFKPTKRIVRRERKERLIFIRLGSNSIIIPRRGAFDHLSITFRGQTCSSKVNTGLIVVIKGMLGDHAMNRILPILLVTDLIKERLKPALFVLIRGNNFHNR
jgi:hypothetical protein